MGSRWWGIRHDWDAVCLGKHESNILNIDRPVTLVIDGYLHSLLSKAMFAANWTSFFSYIYANASVSR